MNLNESEYHILEATLSPLVIDSREQVRYHLSPMCRLLLRCELLDVFF